MNDGTEHHYTWNGGLLLSGAELNERDLEGLMSVLLSTFEAYGVSTGGGLIECDETGAALAATVDADHGNSESNSG